MSSEEISVAEEITAARMHADGCSESLRELVGMIMEDEGLQMSSIPEDAKTLYIELLHCIAEIN